MYDYIWKNGDQLVRFVSPTPLMTVQELLKKVGVDSATHYIATNREGSDGVWHTEFFTDPNMLIDLTSFDSYYIVPHPA